MLSALILFLTRLRQLREQTGLTQEEFAEVSGISYKYYQQLEQGRKPEVRLSTVERVAKVYGLEVYEILGPELPKTKKLKKSRKR